MAAKLRDNQSERDTTWDRSFVNQKWPFLRQHLALVIIERSSLSETQIFAY